MNGSPVLRCRRCGVTSDDWRKDRSTPVTYFMAEGLCVPCFNAPDGHSRGRPQPTREWPRRWRIGDLMVRFPPDMSPAEVTRWMSSSQEVTRG